MSDSYNSNQQESPATSQDPGYAHDPQSGDRWLTLYQNAVLETDSNKLPARIKAAEDAIRERSSLDGQVSREERTALENASYALGVLKRERFENR